MNDTDFRQFLLHGSAQAVEQPKLVQAGPWTAAYIDGDLRYIKFRGHEAIRRIYAAVRDCNWNTIAGKRTNELIEVGENNFRISYQSAHQQNEIDFVWQSTIVGNSDGSIRFEFDGEARSDFYRNRIGYCILHPSEICGGGQAEAYYANGKHALLTFPRYVEPSQPIPAFHDLQGLAHHVIDDFWCRITFEGDLFETEDQRNWIDASFKTYSTPLSLPRPALVKAGTRIRQAVLLRLEERTVPPTTLVPTRASKKVDVHPVVRIEIQEDAPKIAWPKIGSMLPEEPLLDDPAISVAVRQLKLDHVRIDATISDVPLRATLAKQLAIASQLKTAVELVIDMKDRSAENQAKFLAALSDLLKSSQASVCQIAVFGGPKPNVTSHQAIQMVRQHLQWLGVKIGGGSNTDLYQYQLDPIAVGIDFLCWSMNPQVHASDDYSLAETPIGAWEQTRGMHHIDNDMPIVISPITLKPRFNPVAIADQQGDNRALPSSVDTRQMSLLAAAWAVGMLKAVSESGCTSATFFEAAGWKGFIEGKSGSLAPGLFPSKPGMIFPVFYLFEYIGQLLRPLAVQATCSSSREVTSLLLYSGGERHLVLANFSTKPQRVLVGPDSWEQMAVLDWDAVQQRLLNPDQAGFQFKNCRGDELILSNYAIAILKSGQT